MLPMHLMMVHRDKPTFSITLTREQEAKMARMKLLCCASPTGHY